MSLKAEVFALDVLMKNESNTIEILKTYHEYLGEGYENHRRVACGGDQLTCEREVGAQRNMMCGDSIVE